MRRADNAQMRLDLTDLRVFLSACESGSMTVAAQRCHLTLAAVSARIRSLEESAGVLLLRRHARGVAATAAGEALARHARIVFHQFDTLRRDFARESEAEPGTLLLLGNSSALGRRLQGVAAELLERFPEGRIAIRESASEVTVHALHSGAADIGIVSDSVPTEGLEVAPLGPDPLLLIAPRSRPFDERAPVAFGTLLAEEWIVWGQGGALHTHLQMQAFRAGGSLRSRAVVPSTDAVLELVSRGAGVSVLPAALIAQSHWRPRVQTVALADGWARRTLLAVRKPGTAGEMAIAAWEALRRGWEPMPSA